MHRDDHDSDPLEDEEPRSPSSPESLPQPILASRSLLDALEPLEPGRRQLRMLLTAAAAVLLAGLALMQIADTSMGRQPLWLVYGAAIAATAAAPVSYTARAAAAALWSLVGLALLLLGDQPRAFGLSVGVITLVGGLLFRAKYRAARVGRVVVVIGIVSVAIAVGPELFTRWVMREMTWRSWLPVLSDLSLVILLALSLLAFMTPQSTGGVHYWAIGLLCWYAGNLELGERPGCGVVGLIESSLHVASRSAGRCGQPALLWFSWITALTATAVGGVATAQVLTLSKSAKRMHESAAPSLATLARHSRRDSVELAAPVVEAPVEDTRPER